MSAKTKSVSKKELNEDEEGYDNSDYDSANDDENESIADSINLEDDEDEDDVGSGKEDYDSDEDEVIAKAKPPVPVASSTTLPASNPNLVIQDQLIYDDDDDDDDDDDGESYLQKFDTDLNKNYLVDCHPECVHHNYEEIKGMSNVVRDVDNNIIDDLHKTLPYLTKYEKTRVLGQRAKQINSGAKAFVKVPENVIDGYLIAQMELEQKRIPFIIRRPIPNGGSEYWNLRDLEVIGF
jgi:DNA-directed RNA polymerase I, II, and III subunit RPABC2